MLQTLENEASQYPSEVGNYYPHCTDRETEMKRLSDLPKVIQKPVAEMGLEPRFPVLGFNHMLSFLPNIHTAETRVGEQLDWCHLGPRPAI